MSAPHFDVVIIGSGAGGGTMARALADTGARILILERGAAVPREDENWNPEAVWKKRRYQTTETWLDDRGQPFLPYTHYNVGGNSKFWGSVLVRLRREDFHAVPLADGVSPEWPIDYDTLAPYYERAERLYQVHGSAEGDPTEPRATPYPYPPIPHAPGMSRLVEQLRAMGLHPSHLPLGLIAPGESGGCRLCNTCNSFPCRIHAKSDAEVCGVLPALAHPNVTLWTGAKAERILTDSSGARATGVSVTRDGALATVTADRIIVSCGAVNSAALLLKSASDKHRDGLANSSGLVGARYMAHLATMMQGFNPRRVNTDVFQKTVAINDFYFTNRVAPFPLGQIQSQGRTHGVMAQIVVPWIPLWAYDAWVARGVDWLVMSEDLPVIENRVRVDAQGRIHLHYRPTNTKAHGLLVQEMKKILRRLGFWLTVSHSHRNKNTTHQCGTLVFGRDPRTSVLDPYCRTHDVSNLFVVDGSFFPSSAAVNPALTIIAQSLRVADHVRSEMRG